MRRQREEMTQEVEQRWEKDVDRKKANRVTKLLYSVTENTHPQEIR